ncbi:MAG: DUF5916 domain-containing protein [Bacteroidota bacterium]
MPAVLAAQPVAEDGEAPGVLRTSTPMDVPRLTGPIDLDGRVDEPAWDAIAPLELVTHWPEFGNAPSERTEIRLGYDDDHLYLSCRCYAPPEAVFASSFQRDLFTLATDYLAIALDTFQDNENGVYFLVSPTGSRTDAAIAKDANESPDPSWNTYWDTEATITDEGWFSEVRIPFSSLRYEPKDGRVVMGLSTFRYLGRKNELDLFPAIPPDWGFDSMVKPSEMQPVAFEGLSSERPIYVTPYALAGLGQSFDLNEDEDAYLRTESEVFDIGGDLKMSLTDDLTLDLTLNTDFAQVEADDPQVNLTRFSLFFPEKRQFFLERASLFDFPLGGPNRLFYSRRIGLNDGQAVPLLGGGRLVGRAGPWDVGVISLQTGRLRIGENETLPSENFSVLRLRQPVFNANSTAGTMVTSRLGEDGTYNIAVGLDADVRVFEQSFLQLHWVQTFDDAVDFGVAPWDIAKMRVTLARRAYTGTSYDITALRAGSEYRPDLGFETREDYAVIAGSISQGWGGSPGSPFARHQIQANRIQFFRNADTSVESTESGLSWDGQLKSGALFNLAGTLNTDDLREGFELTDEVEVVPGSYTFASGEGRYELPASGALSTAVNAGAGSFYDGWRVTAGLTPTWIASRHLELSGGYEINRIDFPDRDQAFTAHVGTLRVLAALNTKLSAAAFLQINSTAEAGLMNIRLRYNPREGNDFYLVLNEGFNTHRLDTSPARPFTSQRSIVAKYTYTFAL